MSAHRIREFAAITVVFVLALVVIFFAFQIIRAFATDRAPERVTAHVDRVVDGDSFMVSAVVWINQTVVTEVRLEGVDTPERKGKCDKERAAAAKATEFLRTLIEGQNVTLIAPVKDKFGGRIRAHVKLGELDVSAELIKAGLAREYHGEKRASWCP